MKIKIKLSFALLIGIIPLITGFGNTNQSHVTENLKSKIDTVVVIYPENRSFDNLYGLFPGADGIANALKDPSLYIQTDRDGTILPFLPPVWTTTDKDTGLGTPITNPPASLAKPNHPQHTGNYTWIGGPGIGPGKENKPFLISKEMVGMDPLEAVMPPLAHRFYINQMQINNGLNDKFVAWTDIGGLVMAYYDTSSTKMWKFAQQYVLADKFFQGAYGGSFLNHQYFLCACAPEWKQNIPGVKFPFSQITELGPDLHQSNANNLKQTIKSQKSALMGGPLFTRDATFTPEPLDGKYYAINKIQPSFQPSRNKPAKDAVAGSAEWYTVDPTGNGSEAAQPIPPLTQKTIGDILSEANIKWKWYSGGWNKALNERVGISELPTLFSVHHQPFNYYSRFTPLTSAGQKERAEHLKDESDLMSDIEAGTLPPVVFYKPAGINNQHAGYANIRRGDQHMANIIEKLMASPQWKKMAIIVTYDEYGGHFDHAKVPKGDSLGPGTRVPTIIISPHAKKSYIDSTSYDSGSIHQFISRRFNLPLLDGVRKQFGDLTNAFDF